MWKTDFVGNTIASDGRLRTQISTSRPFLWLFGGEFDRKKLDEDVEKLTAYYRGLGFFRARIGRELEFNEKENWVTITFVIDEGPRYKIRNVSVIGNTKYTSDELLAELKLKSGDYFNQAKMTADVSALQDKYGGIGYVFADVKADPRFLEEPAQLDLVYNIKEGDRYRVGKINVDIKGEYPHTQLTTVLNRLSIKPGDIVDIREIRASERRLRASQLFETNPANGNAPKIVFSPPGQEEQDEETKSPRSRRRNRAAAADAAAWAGAWAEAWVGGDGRRTTSDGDDVPRPEPRPGVARSRARRDVGLRPVRRADRRPEGGSQDGGRGQRSAASGSQARGEQSAPRQRVRPSAIGRRPTTSSQMAGELTDAARTSEHGSSSRATRLILTPVHARRGPGQSGRCRPPAPVVRRRRVGQQPPGSRSRSTASVRQAGTAASRPRSRAGPARAGLRAADVADARRPAAAGRFAAGAVPARPDLQRRLAVPRRPARRRRARPAAALRRHRRRDDDRAVDVRRGDQLRRRAGRLDRLGRAELRLDPLPHQLGRHPQRHGLARRRPAVPHRGRARHPSCSGTWSTSKSRTCSIRRSAWG